MKVSARQPLIAVIAAIALGCGGNAEHPATAPVSSIPAPAPAVKPTYPSVYPLLDEAAIEQRELVARLRNRGWELMLEPEGLLAQS